MGAWNMDLDFLYGQGKGSNALKTYGRRREIDGRL